MDYIQLTGSLEKGNQIILEPEDWGYQEWCAICEVFGLEKASRIVLSEFKVEAYGTPCVYAGGK